MIEEAFNRSDDSPLSDATLNHYVLKLLDALAKRNGLDSIIEIGYEMLENPFHIVDLSWKQIAYTKNDDVSDDCVWDEFITTEYLSVKSVSHYLEVHFTPKLLSSPVPFFWNDGYTKYQRLMGRISIGNKAIAAIGVLNKKRPFKESDLQLVSILCDALSAEMQKNKFIHFTKGLLYEDFLNDLLSKKVIDERVIEERAKYLHLDLKKTTYVLAVNIDDFDSTHISLSFIQGILERIIPESKGIIYDSNIVIVVSSSHIKNFSESYEDKINEYFKGQKIHIGVSRVFNNLASIYEYYEQAIEVLKIAARMNIDKLFIHYDDYAIYHIIETCSTHDNIKQFCHPALLKLIKYDLDYNTPFTKSLYTYILCSKSITTAAQELNIHRNTMVYRIEKIIEIMKIDLSDYEALLHIQISFKFMKYNNKYLQVISDDHPFEH